MSEVSYQHFYGKYRGKVTDNRDPLMQGRVRARVPAVFGDEETGWALPCTPYGGKGVGFFFIPPVDANIWIEFENGNPDYPIWVGCFWGAGEAPKMPATPDTKLIKTDVMTMTINDLPGGGGMTIETSTGLKIIMDVTGIELSNNSSSVKLTAASVSINNGALEVVA
jgi:Type VI secretion system/phage-baseplate injector OB domain